MNENFILVVLNDQGHLTLHSFHTFRHFVVRLLFTFPLSRLKILQIPKLTLYTEFAVISINSYVSQSCTQN